MNTTSQEINLIKRICIINFLELQEIKRKLNISTASTQDFYDYKNEFKSYMAELDDKLHHLIKDYPHLWDGN
jgi:hypothetical protein